MTMFWTSAGALQDGWTRVLSAPMARAGFVAVALLGLTLVVLKFSGLS